MAELTRPFPPGDYPCVVVGSGPGALQVSYSLRRNGVDHAVISADPSPGGMFRRWPHFQRLLSWTKPFAPVERASRAYQRYDWNSLLADEADATALQPGLMDGSSYFPSRPEMEANLVAFADKASIQVRYDCTWTGTSRTEGPDGPTYTVETTDGAYTCRVLIIAVGVAQPFTPPGPGMEFSHHYADVRDAETYAGRCVLIVGKQNSGFELANGLLPWARQLILVSPSHAKLSVDTRTLVGVRARYVQPYEDNVLGGGVAILDAALDRVERSEDGVLHVALRRTDGGTDITVDVDDVISATGFVTPLLDLPDLGVATFGQSKVPVQTPWWESATVPGIRFAGTIGQGAKGLQRHGVPSNSGAVHGARYNAQVLAANIAARDFGRPVDRPVISPDDVVDFIVRELADAPELFHQRGYLARILNVDPAGGFRDHGVQPLAHALDAEGANAIAVTLEADGSGAIYPVLYTRIAGATTDHTMEPDLLMRYDKPETRRAVESVVAGIG